MVFLCHVSSLCKHLENIFLLKSLEHKVGFGAGSFLMLNFAFFYFSLAFSRGIKGQKLKTEEYI